MVSPLINFYPKQDVLTTNWTRFPASDEWWDKIDESIAGADDDSTYCQTTNDGAWLQVLVQTPTWTPFGVHRMAIRFRNTGPGSRTYEVRAVNAGDDTTIASLNQNVNSTSYVVRSYEFTAAEVESIDDYANIELWMNRQGSSTGLRVTAVELKTEMAPPHLPF